MELDLTGLPESWNVPSQEVVDLALERTLDALLRTGPRSLDDRLRLYYQIDGNYAGADFLQMLPIDHGAITPADLFATSLLSVKISPL